jgi:glycosyltransferase involved in cell wall biosynthesis
MKKTVLLRAPVLSISGYGVHARQVARWLFSKADESGNLDVTTELLNWGQTPWYTDVYGQDDLIGRCLQASSNEKNLYDVTIQLQLPNEWCPELGKFNVGMTAGVEADRCNPAWIDCINKMNLVIVPSKFTKEVFENSGKVTTPIAVVPESFFDYVLKSDEASPLDLNLETKFNFLIFGQMTGGDAASDRKNLPFTVKWLSETFAGNPDVGIILKTNAGRFTEADKHVCLNSLTQLLQQINKQANPKIYLLHGEMSEEEVVGLYKHPTVKALVSLTHGEGFGLPLLEAAACGVPIITSGWSAHTEFLNLGKYIKIETKSGAIPQSRVDGQIWMQGAQWGMPDEQDFKKRAMRFYEDSSTPRLWAKDLKEKLRKSHNFKAIARIYDDVLASIL